MAYVEVGDGGSVLGSAELLAFGSPSGLAVEFCGSAFGADVDAAGSSPIFCFSSARAMSDGVFFASSALKR